MYRRVLKEGKDIVTKSLIDIFKKSVVTGKEIPSLLKVANVAQVFKKAS